MMKKINLFITKYRTFSRKINDSLTVKTTLKTALSAALIAILIILLPSLLVYNLFVFHKARTLLKISIVLIVWIFSFAFNFTYDEIAKNYHEELRLMNTKLVKVTDSIIGGVILSIITIVIVTQAF